MDDLSEIIARVAGAGIDRIAPLTGGCVGEVYRVYLADGRSLVAKTGQQGDPLDIEGWMLGDLREHSALPVPGVLHAEDRLLVMTHIDGEDAINAAAETHAAELLAALHDISSESYGLGRDTVIGGLRQPNRETSSWVEFFRDQRLMYMGREAMAAGMLAPELMARLESLAARLDEFIGEPAAPSLIHGDMWGGNVLVSGDRIAGFVDPAIYFADAEIELAFSTMFSTFGEAFFRRYDELRPIRPGFFEARREIYNLWPLLVHARLFGGGYADSVSRTLDRFGA